MTILNNVLLTA